MPTFHMDLDGLAVSLFRSPTDGKLCVAIETDDLTDEDTHDGDVPDITISINDSDHGIGADGEWIDLSL